MYKLESFGDIYIYVKFFAEEERKRREEAERRAKLDEIAAKQRQAEIDAEEREKREREARRLEELNKPGKFIPPSLRKKLESGGADSSDTWNDRQARPHLEERPRLFGARGPAAPRDGDRQVDGEADNGPPPSTNRYQPPRARLPDHEGPPRAYEPPRGALRGDGGSRGDAYAPPGRPGVRPSIGGRPVGEGRPAGDRW